MSGHVIELNGKRYDALTGAQIGKGPAKTIDGFIRQTPPAAHKPAHTNRAPVAHQDDRAEHPAGQRPRRPPAPAAARMIPPEPTASPPPKRMLHPERRPHHAARRPEHATTLMRNSVKRPTVKLKPVIKPQSPAEAVASPVRSTLARKHSVAQVNPARLERAVRIPKHTAITRFHHEGTPIMSAAVSAPLVTAAVPLIVVKPEPASGRRVSSAQAGQQHSAMSHDGKRIKPVHATIFETALHRATSHTEPAHTSPKKLRRLANIMAGIGAFLVIAGFIGYLNLPTLELRVASLQAGFGASMPDYRPTGYALAGSIKRNGGTVSMSFRSGASTYTITQQASDWNSQTLLDHTLALSGEHQAVQQNGQTVYIYGDGTNAAWVNGGVRYDLTANAELNEKDIVSIATSM